MNESRQSHLEPRKPDKEGFVLCDPLMGSSKQAKLINDASVRGDFLEGSVTGRGPTGPFWGAGSELALLPGAGYAGGCTSENWAGCTHREPYSASARRTENVNEQMERMLYLAKFCNKYYIGDQAQNIG